MLVSIVIPAFNRAHLITETLDSICAQTYTHWECIVVDDGSTDQTFAVIESYVKQDARFKIKQRPKHKPKGANVCRNIGLLLAQGDYVVFFDSDDLMEPNHLEVKVQGMLRNDVDYVITKTKYFNIDTNKLNYCYRFKEFELTPYNYVAQHINWLTYDVCIKRELAQSIRFNEALQSGQEYNYFSKLTHKSCKAQFIDEVITLRRHHENSIRGQLNSEEKLSEGRFFAAWLTYKDLKAVASKKTMQKLLKNAIEQVYISKTILTHDKLTFVKEVFLTMSIKKGAYLTLMLGSLKVFNKGYWFRKQLVK